MTHEAYEKYPDLFDKPEFRHGPGWRNIVLEMCGHLQEQKELSQNDLKITCVKEKFGILSVYTNECATVAQDSIIHNFCLRSRNVCEDCGTHGRIRQSKSGWVRVLCSKHALEHGYELYSFEAEDLGAAPGYLSTEDLQGYPILLSLTGDLLTLTSNRKPEVLEDIWSKATKQLGSFKTFLDSFDRLVESGYRGKPDDAPASKLLWYLRQVDPDVRLTPPYRPPTFCLQENGELRVDPGVEASHLRTFY